MAKARVVDLSFLSLGKHKRFVLRYCTDYDVEAAALSVGYKKQTGYNLLRKPEIQRAIRVVQKHDEEVIDISRQEILRELVLMAKRDAIDLCDEEGRINLSDLRKLPPHIRRAIDGLDVNQKISRDGEIIDQQVKIKLVSKVPVLDLLMKHLPPEEEQKEDGMSWDKLIEDNRKKQALQIEDKRDGKETE